MLIARASSLPLAIFTRKDLRYSSVSFSQHPKRVSVVSDTSLGQATHGTGKHLYFSKFRIQFEVSINMTYCQYQGIAVFTYITNRREEN